MENLIPIIHKYLPHWNLKIHGENEGFAFCRQNKIATLETDLIEDLGEYRLHDGKPIILLHKFVSFRYRNWVFQHEIGHFIAHPTTAASFSDEVTKRKIEKEANFIAAVSMIPKYILETKTLCEIADEFNVPRKVILFRKYIYDTYKI